MAADYVQQGLSMTAPVRMVVINGRHFASGLFWQPLTKPRAYMKEARQIAKRENMDIVAIRRGTVLQAGFVAKRQGARKGMYSLAASLAGILGNNWLGAFRIDDENYALIGVFDGAILPDCDFISSREEVFERLKQNYSLVDEWEKLYAPKDFEYGGEEKDIHDLLVPQKLSKEYQLQQLKFGLTAREWVLLGIVVVGSTALLWAYQNWKAEKLRKEQEAAALVEAERQRQLDELNRRAKAEQTAKALEHPWASMPAAGDFLAGCVDRIYAIPLSINGWVFTSANCDGKLVRVLFKRQGTVTINDFRAGAQARYGIEPSFKTEGDEANIDLPLDLKYGGDDGVLAMPEALARLQSHLQRLDIKPKLAERKAPEPPPLLPGQDPKTAPPPIVPDWTGFEFSFSAHLTPAQTFTGLDGTGLRFRELVTSIGEGGVLVWTFAGEIYGKK